MKPQVKWNEVRHAAMARIPAGLTFSMFAAAASVGVITILWNLRWPVEPGLTLLTHASAALCLGWGLTGRLVNRYRGDWSRRRIGRDFMAVLQIAMMSLGLLAVIILVYVAVVEGLLRTVYFQYRPVWRVNIWSSGLLDLGMVAGAAWLGWKRSRDPRLVTAGFWILVVAGLWVSLQVPMVEQVGSGGQYHHAVATKWSAGFMVISSVVVAAFTLAAGVVERRRRARAWPDTLWLLTAPPVHWPGFRYSAGVVAVGVLILGCAHIASGWTIPSAFLAGGAMLALAARQWEENLADAGLALITLGVVSLVMNLGPRTPGWRTSDYVEAFNRALVALAIMTWLWHWLAGVWKQQLDAGRPWTPAGRLIRTSQRVGFLVGATAVLVSIHMSFWPKLPFVDDPDTGTSRWIWGLGADGLLIGVLASAARRTGKPTVAWLVLFAAASAAGFALVRSPGSAIGQWCVLHWPIATSLVALGALAAAVAVPRAAGWRPFWEPLYLTGVLIAPMAAIMGVVMSEQFMMPPWVGAGTFGCLAGVYLLAAAVPGPRTFLAAAGICGAMGVWYLRQVVGWSTISSVYFAGILAGGAVALGGLAYRGRARPGTVRFLAWAGVLLLLISGLAALIGSGL